ncbi:unnamed protein product [Prunus armeniaca]|uniref:Uncharacterized protein n=1 Tax=Prunus armeniaca TaxID=36596 RepID=A0A6J5TVH1_PRUAR|nr:unnamed protein product [Prunus armeniaca]
MEKSQRVQPIKALGEEIARKCKGVPLAIRTIGRMLYSEHQETKWLKFKKNKLSTIRQEEDDILPTLQLSYDVLPSHLKHCFAYCSLFPPDYEIPVENLIKLWVAQGFVKSSNECLEDVGYEYYNELVWRSFFQEEKDEFGIIKSCKMHDLMNELAVKVAGEGSRIIHRNKTDFDARRLLHVSFDFDVDLSKWKIPTSLLESNKLRTFLFLRQSRGWEKYLDLSENPIQRLPNWIVKLQNLETLDLKWCDSLVELPRDIKKLINLRHLVLERCDNLAQIPPGLGQLTRLRTLSMFVLSEKKSMSKDSAGLSELGKLKDLRGKLEIRNLGYKKDMVSELNYDGAVLKEKRHLYSLTLHWMGIERENSDAVEEESDVIIKSMEALQPHPSLKQLTLVNYMGARVCENLEHISAEDKVKDFAGDEMMMMSAASPSTTFFPSLESLYLHDCPNLKGWWRNETASASSFRCLSTLSIQSCPNLTSMPLYPNLDSLGFKSSSWKVLPSSFVPSSKLKFLYITAVEDIEYVPEEGIGNLTLLQELSIKNFPNLVSLPDQGMGRLISLQRLHISDCPKLTSLPEGIGNLTVLQKLSIIDCPNLVSLPDQGWVASSLYRDSFFHVVLI